MVEILLDASLFAIPNSSTTKEQAEEIIFRIQEVSDWIIQGYPIVFAAHSEFDSYLSALYPDLDSIAAFLEMCGLNYEYTARDIHQIYTAVIQRLARLDDDVGEVCELEECNSDFDIDEIRPDELRRAMELTLASCVWRQRAGKATCVTSSAPWHAPGRLSVSIMNGKVRRGSTVDPDLRVSHAEDIPLMGGLNEIFDETIGVSAWRSAEHVKDLYSGLWVAAGAHAKTVGQAFPTDKVFAMGENFFTTASKNQCATFGSFSPTALRTCVLYLYEPNRVSRRKFRGPKPRGFDGALPYRSHITSGNPALRLLTWETPEGIVEFANIGPKKELKIYTGKYGSAYSTAFL